jgi:hypothetical protein
MSTTSCCEESIENKQYVLYYCNNFDNFTICKTSIFNWGLVLFWRKQRKATNYFIVW